MTVLRSLTLAGRKRDRDIRHRSNSALLHRSLLCTRTHVGRAALVLRRSVVGEYKHLTCADVPAGPAVKRGSEEEYDEDF